MEKHHELKAIIASVYYLASEAQKSGFVEASILLKRTIADIEKWIKEGQLDPDCADVIDSDLYNIMMLIEKFSQIDKSSLNVIMSAINTFDANNKVAH